MPRLPALLALLALSLLLFTSFSAGAVVDEAINDPNTAPTFKQLREQQEKKAEERREKAAEKASSGFRLPEGVASLPFALVKTKVDIRRGQSIGKYRQNFFLGGCNTKTDPNIPWLHPNGVQEEFDMVPIGNQALASQGYSVIGQSSSLFEGTTDISIARYLLGARITSVHLDVCHIYDAFSARPTLTGLGNGTVKVEWEVFEPLQRKVVKTLVTSGYANVEEKIIIIDLLSRLVQDAFDSAALALGADPEFQSLMTEDAAVADAAAPVAAAGLPSLRLAPIKPFKEPFSKNADYIQRATVVILGKLGGHGSGFIVSADGMVLTNQHVVKQAEEVRVRLHDGVEVIGKVERRDELRDVALVSLPLRDLPALPLQLKGLTIGDAVYAIGAPLAERYYGTVTKGIVSNFRMNAVKGPLIQADVDIQGGNSGGPLVDAQGNVVGISVSGVGPEQFSVGLNFFIPIADALEKLNIRVE